MRIVIRQGNDCSDLSFGSQCAGLRLDTITVYATREELLDLRFMTWSRDELLPRLKPSGHYVWIAEPAGAAFVAIGPGLE